MNEHRSFSKDVTVYVFATAAMLGMALAACTEVQELPSKNGPVEAAVPEGQIVFHALPAQTRATNIDANNLSSFRIGMNAQNGSAAADAFNYAQPFNVVKNDARWNYAPPVYWPEDKDARLSFYAYAPAGSVNVTGFTANPANELDSAVIAYTVPTNSVGQKKAEDFLIAKKSQAESEGQVVQLDFLHALSMARFAASNETADATFIIDSIQLLNLYNQGTLDLSIVRDTANVYWAPVGTQSQTYAPALPAGGLGIAPGSGRTELTSANEDLPVLPQAVAVQDTSLSHAFDMAQPALKVVYSAVSGGKTVVNHKTVLFSFPMTFEAGVTGGNPTYPASGGQFVFQMGRRYTFNLTLGVGNQVQFDVNGVANWEDSPTEKPAQLPEPPVQLSDSFCYTIGEHTSVYRTFSCEDPWTASVVETRAASDWLHLGTASGDAGPSQSITYTLDKNETGAERQGIIRIVSGANTINYLIKQTCLTINGGTVLSYQGTESEVFIPDSLDGYKIVCLGDGNNDFLPSSSTVKKLYLPEGLTDISFTACKSNNLEYVQLPSTIQTIASNAFGWCSSLAMVDFSTATSLKKIGTSAFAGTKLSGTLVLPASLEEIGLLSFSSCHFNEVIFLGEKLNSLPYSEDEVSGNPFGLCSIDHIYCTQEHASSWSEYSFLTEGTDGSPLKAVAVEVMPQ